MVFVGVFGTRLRQLRLERRWKMKDFAEKVSELSDSTFTVNSLSNWELKGTEPPYDILAVISKVLDVSTDYLIGASDNPLNISISDEQQERCNQLYEQLLNLPTIKQEKLKLELDAYLNFFNYKEKQLHMDFETFANYLQNEIKNS